MYVSGENNWTNWRRISSGSPEAYIFATLCVVIASLLRWGLGLLSEHILHLPDFPTFYPAVLFSALIGGAGAGVFAAALGGFIGWWVFMPPHFTSFAVTLGQQIGLLMYFLASLLIVWAADHYRKITKRLEDEEKFRKLAVDELAMSAFGGKADLTVHLLGDSRGVVQLDPRNRTDSGWRDSLGVARIYAGKTAR